MQATGSSNPIVYMLGEAPGEVEDKTGIQFSGSAGQLLRPLIPEEWQDKIRWNNTLRCRPPKNRDPDEVETEACRPSIIRDIENTKPRAIFAFGNFPLNWLLRQSGITIWRGRYVPVKIGSHTCWAFCFLHPAFAKRKGRSGLSDEEMCIRFDLDRAFNLLNSLPNPEVHTRDRAISGTIFCTGSSKSDLEVVTDFLDAASHEELAGVDYETFPLRPYDNGRILSAAVSTGEQTLAFGWHHPEAGFVNNQSLPKLEQAWIRFLKSPVRKAIHNLRFEQEWSAYLWGWDIIRSDTWDDTITQAFVLDERVGALSLEFLVLQHFGINIKEFAGVNAKDLRNEPILDVLKRNALDAKYHRYLYEAQHARICAEGLGPQYKDMLSRVRSCVLTQLRGVPFDRERSKTLSTKYGNEIASIEDAINTLPEAQAFHRRYGKPYNPSSPQQVKQLCEGILHINVHSDEDNKDHTDKDILKQIDLPITRLTIKIKEVKHLKSTYVDKIPVWSDDLIHQNLNTVFVKTSRSSSDDCNMQNFPKRTAEGKEVRKQIKAPPGQILLAADSKQIQARNVAMESKDPVFCKMLWENYDIHGEWARRLALAYPNFIGGSKNINDVAIMKTFRDNCKSWWTFALLFGAQLETICNHHLHAPIPIIKPLYEEFWNIFSGIAEWQENLVKQYQELGYVTNLTGIRLRAPLRHNQIINGPIQADEAAIIFDAFKRLTDIDDLHLQPILEIHDDLTLLVPKDQLEDYAETVIDEMVRITFDWINVPLGVELSKGDDWYSMTEIGEYFSHKWHGTPNRPDYAL